MASKGSILRQVVPLCVLCAVPLLGCGESAPTVTSLIAVGDQGAMMVSDDGVGWQRLDSVVEVDLFDVAAGAGSIAAVAERAILLSDHGGESWRVVDDESERLHLRAVAHDGSRLLAAGHMDFELGGEGPAMYKLDREEQAWVPMQGPTSHGSRIVTSIAGTSRGLLVTYRGEFDIPRHIARYDGARDEWEHELTSNEKLQAIDDGRALLAMGGCTIFAHVGEFWARRFEDEDCEDESSAAIAQSPRGMVAISRDRAYRSDDGVSWTTHDLPLGLWNDVVAYGEMFFAVGRLTDGGGLIAVSDDGGRRWTTTENIREGLTAIAVFTR